MLIRKIDQDLFASYSDDIPTFLKNIYAARGVSEAQLSLGLDNLLRPNFGQLDIAFDLLEKALLSDKRILIVGDFDCDGATASVVAVKSLRLMGAKYVDFLVPNRFEHGYGLSPEIVGLAIQEKQPDLIITVDNGISSFDGVALAKASAINVIITDHHLPSETLPEADAIINPNLKECEFASKNLAGVGVCFYLMSALKTHLSKRDYFTKHNIVLPDLRTVLDLVALGTVADVVKLDQNNRILIDQGLKRIRAKQCSPGILALLEIANRKAQTLQASDLGFAVGPRLNAAGRLSDISRGIKCLLTDDINDARRYAAELEQFNQARKEQQALMQEQAQAIIDTQSVETDKFALSLFDASWHEGIVGIVAGKLKENYHCPVAVFAQSGEEFIKGSIRSIADVHIKDLLDLIDRKNPNLILKFGGHAMAAGLSIKKENFAVFKKVFNDFIQVYLNNELPKAELLTDGRLEAFDITLNNAQRVADSGPWGQGFEAPIFQGDFEIVSQRIVGEKHLKCSLKLVGDNTVYDGIAFFQAPIDKTTVQIAYKLSINEWQGKTNLQLMVEQIK
ncbi:single-stranded-DNA-specific exonuclease RecJ [bacterium endosymbiont of Bathymodiolus sp. 5 South]|jgi:single-stranded-DNA-specific exonuclease|uniref:single-stranded-DNA-specific exonuclease RecJ n=1 Tax=bacterium endosymbiont of Bathymodiolus sp. 5 South TaxID=1181670 RepID=UPI0010AFC7BE|nr:single-stranded-DNA-specific exonuclease RecJ [bacterium endosymbiont of Bathymodiolus sp. 5 South]CAC9652316.1 Single-stranded-DNA-specific exonuclease RecJ (EC 3.1.-.-) [uncultured Gammaproteobacteria bacterium]SHN89446.1 Single-stranded-DNA-specific exonuclease RecJ [bacterium endosymbiont of Bathymodiolus sp. 5 South]SSC08529.1 Single-stranded-DNA-specific exonuclease RecJ [bacterium endosymbiont of Bathymodiolus sp. 5 South]VVH55389.1 Single-stranded-DNA-specific exonuclease RecJ (EC [u